MIKAPHLPLGREDRNPDGIGFLALVREDFQTHGRARIGNDVNIGTGAVVIGAITIGDGAIIGAKAAVTADATDGAITAGMPAQKIGQR